MVGILKIAKSQLSCALKFGLLYTSENGTKNDEVLLTNGHFSPQFNIFT